jgi:hypothetical protein
MEGAVGWACLCLICSESLSPSIPIPSEPASRKLRRETGPGQSEAVVRTRFRMAGSVAGQIDRKVGGKLAGSEDGWTSQVCASGMSIGNRLQEGWNIKRLSRAPGRRQSISRCQIAWHEQLRGDLAQRSGTE